MSQLVISSKVAAYSSQPVAYNGHLSVCGHLTGLRNKSQRNQTSQLFFWQWYCGNINGAVDS